MEIKWLKIFSLICSIKAQDPQCYTDIMSPYLNFSHRTSYNVSRAADIKTPENCTATYLWALIRHGTRYNSAKEINEMKSLVNLKDQILLNHQAGRGKLCEKDFINIKNWKFLLNENLDYKLTQQGRLELSSLAKRLKQRFPNLLSSLSKNNFIFQSSGVERAKDSAIAFTNELLKTDFEDVIGNNITENQKFLHLVKICTKYNEEVKNNYSTYEELRRFKKSYEIYEVLVEVSKRLGFEYVLAYKNIDLMYKSCAYENAWYVNSKPAFCAAFTEENLKVLEYTKDLEYYWDAGYGHPMNEKLGCELVRDMITTLSNAAKMNDSKVKASFYFSHSEMILPFLVKLKLNHDEKPLQFNNFFEMKEQRKWKLSFLDCFAANVIVILFKCPNYGDDENQIVFYQNEHEIIFPGCSESPCSLQFFQQHFEDVYNLSKCNSDFCYYNSPNLMKSLGIVTLPACEVILSLFFLLKIHYI